MARKAVNETRKAPLGGVIGFLQRGLFRILAPRPPNLTVTPDYERVLDVLISEAQRTVNRQWEEAGELSRYAVGVLAAVLTAVVFVSGELGRFRSGVEGYRLQLLWEGSEVCLLWASFAIWRSLLYRPLATGSTIVDRDVPAMSQLAAVGLKESLFADLRDVVNRNRQRNARRIRRFYAGHALVCAAIWPLSLAITQSFSVTRDLPLGLTYVAAGSLALTFAVTQHRSLGPEVTLWLRLWIGPAVLIVFYVLGPVVLLEFRPVVLQTLPTEYVVAFAAIVYGLLFGAAWLGSTYPRSSHPRSARLIGRAEALAPRDLSKAHLNIRADKSPSSPRRGSDVPSV